MDELEHLRPEAPVNEDTTKQQQRTSQDARTQHRDDALDRAIERFQDERDNDADEPSADEPRAQPRPAVAANGGRRVPSGARQEAGEAPKEDTKPASDDDASRKP